MLASDHLLLHDMYLALALTAVSLCPRAELSQFCSAVPHENVAAIRCLQDKAEDPTFGAACRQEVQKYEQHISADYRCEGSLAARCQ